MLYQASLLGIFSLPLTYALNARAPQGNAVPSPCSAIGEVIASCEAALPNFTDLSIAQQADCVCYSSGSFIGDEFDNAVGACVSDLVAEGDSNDASSYAPLSTFCSYATAAGGGSGSSVPATATITSGPAVTPTPTSGSSGNDPCALLGSALDFCESVSPGFTDFAPATQAGCLCYSSTSWDPNFLGDIATSCLSELEAAGSTSLASDAAFFTDFCSSIGDVGNPPTVSASGTPVPIQSLTSGLPTATGGSAGLGGGAGIGGTIGGLGSGGLPTATGGSLTGGSTTATQPKTTTRTAAANAVGAQSGLSLLGLIAGAFFAL